MKQIILSALHHAKKIKYHEAALFNDSKNANLPEAKKQVDELRKKTRNLKPREQVKEIIKAEAGNCFEHSLLVMDFFEKIKQKFPETQWTAEMVRIKLRKNTPGEMVDHVVVIAKENPYHADYWVIDGLFSEFFASRDISQLKVPICWYTHFTKGYELKAFDPEKHEFETYLTLAQFMQNCPAKELGISLFESLLDSDVKSDKLPQVQLSCRL